MQVKKMLLSRMISCLVCAFIVFGIVTTSTADSKDSAKHVIIHKVNLKFEDHSKVHIAAQNEELHIVAEVYFEGSGLLQAEWEVATPTSTAGKAQFTRLSILSEILGLGKVLQIKSPPLPTLITGSYLVRFRVIDPKSKLEPVTIGYSVGQASH